MRIRIMLSLFLVVLLLICLPIMLFADNTNSNSQHDIKVVRPEVIYAPPEGTIINGVEEGSVNLQDEISPMVIDYDHPVFINYISDYSQEIDYYKLIAKTSYKNQSPTPELMELEITRSSSSSSTFNGDVTFTGSIQTGILNKVKTEIGFGLSLTKGTNAAVGYRFENTVPAGKTGYIEAYWGGVESGGTLVVKYPDTYSETGYTKNFYIPIDTTLHITENVVNAYCYIR